MSSAFVRRIAPSSRRRVVNYDAGPTPPPGTAVDLTGTATYYVDSAAGSNANNGTSAATPKQTIAGLPALVAGNIVALKAGSEFREALPMAASGSSGSPIVWGMYGSGAHPKIKGSKDYGTSLSWSLNSGSIYQATATAMPTASNLVYIDELTPLRKYASLAALQGGAAGGYFADTTNNILYVWMWDNSNPALHRVEVNGLASTLPINTGSRSYITFQDLAIMHGSGNNAGLFSFSTSPGIIVQRNIIGPHFGAGIYAGGTGMIVQDNLIRDCWDAIEYPTTSGSGVGIYVGAGANATGVIIRRNWISGCTHGIRINGPFSTDIYLNYIYLNHVNGIDNYAATAGTGTPVRVVNNTVWHRPTGPTPAGHGIDQQTAGTGLFSKNNIVFTDFTGVGATNVEAFTIASGTSANTLEDYNLGWVDPASTGVFGKIGTTTYASATAYWAASRASYGSSQNVNSKDADPKFVGLGNADPRLRPDSPAIGAGVAVSGITDTADFTASPPHLGAFQVVGTPV